jgi:transposase
MPTTFLGIDIAKSTFDVALLSQDNTPKHKKFQNTKAGFFQLDAWLKQQMATDLHACLEATGIYGDALARHLHASGHKVSVVNPSGPKAFARARLSRTKTDKADAIRIAQFCQAHRPHLWTPPLEEVATLQALVRRLEALNEMHQRETQRLESTPPSVLSSVQAVLNVLDEQISQVEQQIKDHIDQHPSLKEQSHLLESIPGIGASTAARLLGEFGDWTRFGSARAAAAYVGLVPRIHQSGTSVRGRSVLCKMGNARLRKSLYFPALTALRFNPVLTAMAERLKAASKSKMAIVGAAMRRLVHLCYGVLKSGKPFDASIPLNQARKV